MNGKLLRTAFIMAALMLAACGTIAPPIWEKPTATATPIPPTKVGVAATPVVAQAAAATAVPATSTPEPPTVTTIPTQPSATPIPPPAAPQSNDPIAFFVSQSDSAHGKELFNTFYNEASYMCATCHRVDSTQMLIGPGLLGISQWAAENIKDQIPERYIYTSIVDPRAYTVAGYEDKAQLMPNVYSQVLSEQDVYDIVAYLMSLK